MRNEKLSAYFLLHFCVLLWGLTAPLGKLIQMPALDLVWMRMSLTSLFFLMLWLIADRKIGLSLLQMAQLCGIGVLVAFHWLTFYGSIKLANASVGLLAFATTALFSSFMEPLLNGKKPHWREVIPGFLILPGIILIATELPTKMNIGLLVGLFSAFLCAIFGALNKRMSSSASPLVLSGIEMSAGALTLSLVMLLMGSNFEVVAQLQTGKNILWMSILVFGCTAFPFLASFWFLRHLTAFTAAMALNLEPVYGVLLSVVFLQEQTELPPTFFMGLIWILVVVGAHGYWTTRKKGIVV